MAGPCSYPAGDKAQWDTHNEIVCDVHFHCNWEEYDKNGNEVKHDFITYRVWLLRRNRLRTGKS